MDIFPYDTKDENGGERYMPFQVCNFDLKFQLTTIDLFLVLIHTFFNILARSSSHIQAPEES